MEYRTFKLSEADISYIVDALYEAIAAYNWDEKAIEEVRLLHQQLELIGTDRGWHINIATIKE